jgi:hypothetical protein
MLLHLAGQEIDTSELPSLEELRVTSETTDDGGNHVNTFRGAAAEFLGPGQWELAA